MILIPGVCMTTIPAMAHDSVYLSPPHSSVDYHAIVAKPVQLAWQIRVATLTNILVFSRFRPPGHSMEREWTDQQRDGWIERRTKLREQRKRTNPRSPSTDSLERERSNVREAVRETIEKTVSWEVGFPYIHILVDLTSGKLSCRNTPWSSIPLHFLGGSISPCVIWMRTTARI